MNHFLKLLVLSFFVISCQRGKEKQGSALYNLTENTGIDFTNNVQNNNQFNIFSYRNFYNGGGVAIGDINNDGLADVFFSANMGANKLFINKGSFRFEDVSAKSGFVAKED